MAGKQGRPRRTQQNAEINEVGKDQKTEEKASLAEKVEPEKVIEVKTKPKQPPKIRPSQRNRGLHEVIIKGKTRLMTKASYDAVKKDPGLNVILPKGSLLVEPNLDKPCKDC